MQGNKMFWVEVIEECTKRLEEGMLATIGVLTKKIKKE